MSHKNQKNATNALEDVDHGFASEDSAGPRSGTNPNLAGTIGLHCQTLGPGVTNLHNLPGVPLLAIGHGTEASVERDCATGALRSVLPMAPLPTQGGDGGSMDLWSLRVPTGRPARSSARTIERGPVQALRVGDVMGGAALFDGYPLGPSVTASYRALMDLLREEDMHLVRVWNAVPAINQELRENGKTLDRYMVFCRARADVMEEYLGHEFAQSLSAASAVGACGNRGIVLFLAARKPGTSVSNPRQEEAWRYPERYGPRSPSFARATRLGSEFGGGLLISGTASIIGAESLHRDDPGAQLEETLANIKALLRAAQTSNVQRPLHDLTQVRVYVKDPTHLALFRDRLLPELAPMAQVHWVEAHVCRPELLIEIEGLAR